MTRRRITVDRISLQLEGLPVAQAEFLAAQLQAALAASLFPGPSPSPSGGRSEDTQLETDLVGPELVRAVAARLMDLIGAAAEVRSSSEV